MPRVDDGIARSGRLRSVGRSRRHLLLGLAATALCVLVDLLLASDDLRFRLSMSTAYASLIFLSASLAVGPLRVLRGRHAPANIFLRRDLGIWAGALGLVHVAAGFTVHFRGDMWKYFFVRLPTASDPLPLRLDAFGAAVYTGTASALVLLLLLALSNNWSLRRLGTRRWKSLQRWSYAGFALMAIHSAAFQVLESRAFPWVAAFILVLAAVTGLQWAGYRRFRGGDGT